MLSAGFFRMEGANMNESQRDKDAQLAELRGRIEEVDRQFAHLLARRQNLSKEVAERKMDMGVPLRNYSVESRVHERFMQLCRDNGLEERWGIDLASFLIDRSVELQSTMMERRATNGRKRIVVVGGCGRMGNWISGFFDNQGHDVLCCDTSELESPYPRVELTDTEVHEADVVVVSVPLTRSPEVLKELLELRPEGLVFDLCSVKREVEPILRDGGSSGLMVTSLHPLFGPDVTTLYGRKIVICSCGNRRADAAAHALFAETAADISILDAGEHDKLMTLTLGMSHALNLLFATVLASEEEDFKRLNGVASSTFSKQISTTLDVVGENMDLYYDIQQLCDHALIYRALGEAAERIGDAVEKGDRASFLSEMGRAVEFFGVSNDSVEVSSE